MKKTAKNKKQSKKNIKIISICLVTVLAVITALILLQQPINSTTTQITQSKSSAAKITYSSEARAVGDAYFEAAKQCDIEKANSYRLLPKDIPEKEAGKCKQECPGGIAYEFVKQLGDVERKEENGEVIEIVGLEYWFGCNGEKHPTLLSMTRSSVDNKWMVLSSF